MPVKTWDDVSPLPIQSETTTIGKNGIETVTLILNYKSPPSVLTIAPRLPDLFAAPHRFFLPAPGR